MQEFENESKENPSGSNWNRLLWTAAGVGALFVAKEVIRQIRSYRIAGKVVLITGGARGLGLVMARKLADRGAKLAICSRSAEELETARQELANRGAEVIAIPCDVTDHAQVMHMIGDIRNQFGQIDVLINNAGVISVGPIEVTNLADYETAMKTHFWAPLYTMLAVIPMMKQRRQGRIVNISSVGGKVSLPHQIPYSASKFALIGLSEGMRSELMKDNVLVTTVAPGLTRTGSPRQVTVKGNHEEEYAWFKKADSLPLLTMSAEKAAGQIIDAFTHGEAEVTLTLPGKFAAAIHGLFPGVTADVMGILNNFLPNPVPGGTTAKKGYDSESSKSKTAVTALTDEAARNNNEMESNRL